MTLFDLELGKSARIAKFISSCSNASTHEILNHRLMEMGLTTGAKVTRAYNSPFGGAVAFFCRGSLIAIRNEDAVLIEVTPC